MVILLPDLSQTEKQDFFLIHLILICSVIFFLFQIYSFCVLIA